MKLDEDRCTVTYVPLGATKHTSKSIKSKCLECCSSRAVNRQPVCTHCAPARYNVDEWRRFSLVECCSYAMYPSVNGFVDFSFFHSVQTDFTGELCVLHRSLTWPTWSFLCFPVNEANNWRSIRWADSRAEYAESVANKCVHNNGVQ